MKASRLLLAVVAATFVAGCSNDVTGPDSSKQQAVTADQQAPSFNSGTMGSGG